MESFWDWSVHCLVIAEMFRYTPGRNQYQSTIAPSVTGFAGDYSTANDGGEVEHSNLERVAY
jgi:hypothetical protein